MEKRLQRMTPIQLQMLVDILSVNPELISGKLTPHFTGVDRRNKWQALATLLNSKGLGPQKDADKWRKSWTDLKFAIRSKAAKIELAGGADLICEKLSNLEKRVLRMIGDVTTIGNSEVDEGESGSSTDKFPNEIQIEHTLVNELHPNKMKRNLKELLLPITVASNSEVLEGRCSDKTAMDLDHSALQKGSDDDEDEDDDDDNDDGDDDDDGDDEESPENNLNESLFTPPPKRRRVSSESTCDSKPAVVAVQRQMRIQTAVLKEQTSIMKDIAKSLQSIAKALQNR